MYIINFVSEENYFTFLRCLHALVPPTKSAKSKEKNWKFSIADSQLHFMEHHMDLLSFEESRKCLIKKNTEYKLATNVVLAAVGDSLNICKFYVTFYEITYPFDTIIKAVEMAFKIHFVFQLEYQRQTQNFWQLLQHIFYPDLPVTEEYCIPEIKRHAEKIKKLMQK